MGLYSYLYPQDKVDFILANESPECRSSNWIDAADFSCAVYYLNETRHLYPMANEKIVCETPDPLGDSLYAMACLKTIKNIEEKPIVVLGRKFSGESPFQFSPYVSAFIDKDQMSHPDFAIQHLAKEYGRYYHLLPNLYNAEPGHIIDNTLRQYKLPVDYEHLSISWNTAIEQDTRDCKSLSERTVLLHANNDALNRSWLRSEWVQLAKLFLGDGWKVLLIGATSSSITKSAMYDIDVPGVKNLVNKLSISETQKLMSESQLLVSCDSGPIALAGTTNIAIVGLYSIVKGDRRIPYRYGQKGWNSLVLDLNCEYENCFDLIRNPQFTRKLSGTIIHKEYVAWPLNRACIKKALGGDAYECLTLLSASDLFNKIITAFSDGRLR